MSRRLTYFFLTAIVLSLVALTANAQTKPLGRVSYHLAMSRPASHLFEVSIEVAGDKNLAADHIDFQMARWSPGRYGVSEFAKNVEDVAASASVCDEQDRCHPEERTAERIDTQTWRVNTASVRTLTLSYKVFADDLSGTFSRLEPRQANFNGGSIFMYLVDHKSDPVTLQIDPPAGWRIANGYSTEPNQRNFQFANYDLLMDTPTVIGPSWTMDEFKVEGKNYRVVVTNLGPDGGKRPELVRQVEKIVRAGTAMWGPPECDNYTFLLTFAADDDSGDGMEHLTSTNIIVPTALADDGAVEGIIDAISHEFFHTWNGKRLRPAELGPWDFTKPVNTRGLWFYEGLTNYYGSLILHRAGIWSEREMLDSYSGNITYIEYTPGNRRMSAEIASLTASFHDGAAHAQRVNLHNNTVSYYNRGEAIGLVLDLTIRAKTNGRASLDDVMKRLYQDLYLNTEKASYYLRGRGYTPEDVIKAVSDVAETDMRDFFRRYVSGTEPLPYEEALRPFGLQLSKTPATLPGLIGFSFGDDGNGAVRITNLDEGSPAEDAGLNVGDVITEVGGQKITESKFREVLTRYHRGDTVKFTFKRDRRTLTAAVTVGDPVRYNYRIVDLPGATAEQKALRAAWAKQVVN